LRVVVNGSEPIARGLQGAGFDIAPAYPRAFDALVHVPDVAASAIRTPLSETSDAEWDVRGEAVVRAALNACQAAYAAMRDRGGRVVLVAPTIGLVGADGLAPLAMAVEGIRTLAKSAARQWGRAGITTNCVAPSLDVLGIAAGSGGLVTPPLGRIPTIDDLVAVIGSVLGPAGNAITGATIIVDGGVVMAP
jgi:3-oxoacyl-[acyl-carrier protein] reductase